MNRSFDTIAVPYYPLERMVFGNSLQAAREFCLPFASGRKTGLLIGDGDGRFSTSLLQTAPNMAIDSIDISSKFLDLAQKRAGENRGRLNTMQADALKHSYPRSHYDFMGLHFCLDCFPQNQIDTLLPKLEGACTVGAIVAYSDFNAERFWQRAIVKSLYVAFRLSAGLKVTRLPQIRWSSEMTLVASQRRAGGLVISQIWTKTCKRSPRRSRLS